MSTQVKIINNSTHPLPQYATVGSAGVDLYAHISQSITLDSLERVLIPTGISIELPDGHEAQIRPRSGLALKHGISIVNSPGTIDTDFRGEIGIVLVNLSKEPFEIKPGERIAQMVIARYTQVEWQEVNTLSDTTRNTGGYGSTGR